MLLFRIAKTRHINDLSGAGARTYGGRWNEKGVAVIYTSETRSLAALEYLVHASIPLAPKNLSMLTVKVPDTIIPVQVDADKLPHYWGTHPAPETLAQTGSDWVRSNNSLLLRVPSAIINEEYNVIINPNHPDSKHIKVDVEKFVFDDRLIKK